VEEKGGKGKKGGKIERERRGRGGRVEFGRLRVDETFKITGLTCVVD